MLCEIPRVINNKEGSRPVLKEEVSIKNGMGTFEIFGNAPINQGFQWSTVNNVSYMREPGSPSDEAFMCVRRKVVEFTSNLGMNGEVAVLAQAVPYNTEIIDITDTNQLMDCGIQGQISPEGGAFFTTISRLPLYSIMPDCTQTIVYGEMEDGSGVVGIIHSGRNETDDRLPHTAIQHAMDVYSLKPEKIRLGISPSLEPKYHTVRSEDMRMAIQNPDDWESYMIYSASEKRYHFDVRSYVAAQYIEAGIPSENIEVCLQGTYEHTGNGHIVSYRRARVEIAPLSCLGIAVELR